MSPKYWSDKLATQEVERMLYPLGPPVHSGLTIFLQPHFQVIYGSLE